MVYYIEKFFSRLVCLLPHGLAVGIGDFFGLLTWRFIPERRRKMAVGQVMECLGVGEGEALEIAKDSWRRFGPMLMEVMRFPVLRKDFASFVTIEGKEYLEEGLKLGKGAVIATSHAGNWELMGGALCSAGFPIIGVAKKQKDAGSDKFINEYRELIGMHVTYKTDVREMFRLLKDGKIIGLLSDQEPAIFDGVRFEWFGKLTNFVQGPAVLARWQGAPLFPGFITRNADGTHKIIIHPPIFVEKTKDKAADVRKAMMAVMAALERHIKEHAGEWFWLHDRWKSMKLLQGEQLEQVLREQEEWKRRGLP